MQPGPRTCAGHIHDRTRSRGAAPVYKGESTRRSNEQRKISERERGREGGREGGRRIARSDVKAFFGARGETNAARDSGQSREDICIIRNTCRVAIEETNERIFLSGTFVDNKEKRETERPRKITTNRWSVLRLGASRCKSGLNAPARPRARARGSLTCMRSQLSREEKKKREREEKRRERSGVRTPRKPVGNRASRNADADKGNPYDRLRCGYL